MFHLAIGIFVPGLLSQGPVTLGVCINDCMLLHLQVLKNNGSAAPAPV